MQLPALDLQIESHRCFIAFAEVRTPELTANLPAGQYIVATVLDPCDNYWTIRTILDR